ncbi:MAG: DUF2147 domain-containing protein [Hyphomicrobiaceae bacterium]|nr:DUF2147 domain-containing protein [Hyphomicrobiaceae bacterium]
MKPRILLLFRTIVLTGLWFLTGASTHAEELAAPILLGTWLTDGQSEITIDVCDQGYCGQITKIELPQDVIDKYGPERIEALQGDFRDVNNEDARLRDRPLLGLTILVLDHQVSPDHIEGAIYNPKDGKTYDGFADIVDGNRIMVGGCVAWRTICNGELWIRAPVVVADQVAENNG